MWLVGAAATAVVDVAPGEKYLYALLMRSHIRRLPNRKRGPSQHPEEA